MKPISLLLVLVPALTLTLTLTSCTGSKVMPQPPIVTPAPTPTPTTPTPSPTPQPQPQPTPVVRYGFVEVCVRGLGVQPGDWPYKLMSYAVQVGGPYMYLTADKPCKVYGVDETGSPTPLPEGATYEVVAHPGANGLSARPERQTVTVVANAVTRVTVEVGWW